VTSVTAVLHFAATSAVPTVSRVELVETPPLNSTPAEAGDPMTERPDTDPNDLEGVDFVEWLLEH
jgi:hypothetical protein